VKQRSIICDSKKQKLESLAFSRTVQNNKIVDRKFVFVTGFLLETVLLNLPELCVLHQGTVFEIRQLDLPYFQTFLC